MILGHIGVRKGSKGVPGKNMRDFFGKPLLDWALDDLLTSSLIDRVVVSTDDPDVLDHVAGRGCIDIGLRPAHLATDGAGKWDVWQHALGAVEAQLGPADIFLDLDVTCPLRLPKDIDGALDLFMQEKPDMVMSCSPCRKNPYFNMLEIQDHGGLGVSKPLPGGVVARQQAPTVLEHVGVVYAVRPGYLRRATALFEGKVIPYMVPYDRGLDIDSPEDWDLVSYYFDRHIKQGLRQP